MRNAYSVVVDNAEKDHLHEVLKSLKVKSIHVDNNDTTSVYHVDLSKYECLALRLFCKTGMIKPVNPVIHEVE